MRRPRRSRDLVPLTPKRRPATPADPQQDEPPPDPDSAKTWPRRVPSAESPPPDPDSAS